MFQLVRAACVLVALVPAVAAADEAAPADTAWNLFHPTPRARLKGILNKTSARTVDAGHAQLDVDVASTTWSRTSTSDRRSLKLFAFKARLGLTPRLEVQLDWFPYRETHLVVDGATMDRASGIGDTRLGLGVGLWGESGGKSAGALLPYLRLPTSTGGVGSDVAEGGVAFALGLALPHRVSTLICPKVAFVDGHQHPKLSLAVGAERMVAGPVSLKLAWLATADTTTATTTYTHEVDADGGVAIGKDLEVHLGTTVAVPELRRAITPYVSVSYRR